MDVRSELDMDVIRNLKPSLDNELSMVKTKIINLEKREKHQEVEMEEMRRMLFDQHALIKRLLTELSEYMNGTNTSTPLREQEVNEITDTSKYTTILRCLKVRVSVEVVKEPVVVV